jgi:hypothetical protein
VIHIIPAQPFEPLRQHFRRQPPRIVRIGNQLGGFGESEKHIADLHETAKPAIDPKEYPKFRSWMRRGCCNL